MSYKFGAIQSLADHRDYLYRAIFTVESLPSKYSRRLSLGPVRDQGSFGSCVGFASSGVKDSQEGIKSSPLYIYKRCKELDGIPDQEGTYPRVAMKVLSDYGVCPEGLFPYSGMSWPNMPSVPAGADQSALQFKIGAYAKIGTINEVKQAIVKDGPVLGAILVCENFINTGSNGIVELPNGQMMGGHAICVTGYDDNMKANGYTGFFEVRNSWGVSWGEAGFCYIPYEFFTGRFFDNGMPYWFESWSSVDIVLPPAACKKGYIWLNKAYAEVDGVEVKMDCAPLVDNVNNRVMVPLRFMAEHMGYKVEWNQVLQQVYFYK
jgi:hypothetical protein